MGYNNNQWHRLPNNEYTTPNQYGSMPIQPDNPKFIYPSNVVRYTGAGGEYVTETLKRGYIRSLTTNVQGKEFEIQKCAFQFNPQTIRNDVTLSNSYYDILHQPPEQFSQPMPGNTNFAFTLIFDRSMEINNPAGPTDRINEVNPWELSSPSQVGVLRDLQAFYSVIGQGISEDQKDFLVAKLEQAVIGDANRRQSSGNNLAQTDVDEAASKSAGYIQQNVGNSSFLIPVPVRVLFSSLYMVEGFVTSTNTELLKFSTNMVPMVAKVVVSMEAKYVGFAREKTYLTDTLANAEVAYLEEQAAEADRTNDVSNTLSSAIGTVQMAFGDEDAGRAGRYPSNKDVTITDLLDGDGDEYRLWFNIPGVYNNANNAVTKWYDEGQSVGVGVYPTLSLYGPFTSAQHTSYTGNQNTMASLCKPEKLLLKARGLLSDNGVAATKDDWNKGARASKGDLVKANTTVASPETKYYIAKYEVSATVVSDEVKTSGFGDIYKPFGPGFDDDDTNGLEHTLTVNWPRATLQDGSAVTTTGTLAADNTATDPKPAGSTSSVGSPGGSSGLRIS